MGKRSRRRASAAPSAAGSPFTGPLADLTELAELVDLADLADSADLTKDAADRASAPVDYTDPTGNMLTLRKSFPAAARREYAQTLSGARGSAAATREDAWQRAVELLFERLAVRWTLAGATPIERPRELLLRYRSASTEERAWVRDVLREHCAEHFPDVRVP